MKIAKYIQSVVWIFITFFLFGMSHGAYAASLANGTVNATVIQPDGKILIGGNFTTYNDTARARIARINTDGTLDTSFDSGVGADSVIHAIALQSDGKIIVGGEFTSYSGTVANCVVRLNSDGTLDTSFDSGTEHGPVYSVAIQSDGKIVVGEQYYIERLNSDGSHDFTRIADYGSTYAIAIQNDGKIIIGGSYSTYNYEGPGGITRINTDGSYDSSFSPSGYPYPVYSIVIQSDGKIIIAGAGQSEFYGITRVNSDGSSDPTFNAVSNGAGQENVIRSMAIQPDGKIVIGGEFDTYNESTGDVTGHYIARLNSDGSIDTGFNFSINTAYGIQAGIKTIAIRSNGEIIVGGEFDSYYDAIADAIVVGKFLALLSSDGTFDMTFGEAPLITPPTLPTQTPSPTSITDTTATGNGTITETGG
ncbi:MAG: hypothetical protein WC819_02440, partial [Parcubacteria group bacterium]